MDTKWKDKDFKGRILRAAGFLLVLIGILLMMSVLTFGKQVYSYVRGEDYPRISFTFNDSYRMEELIKSYLYSEQLTKTEKEVLSEKLDSYYQKGYRYAVVANENNYEPILKSDGKEPVYQNVEDIVADYNPPLSFTPVYEYSIVVFHEMGYIDENTEELAQLLLSLKESNLSTSEWDLLETQIQNLTRMGYRWAIISPDGSVMEADEQTPVYNTIEEISNAVNGNLVSYEQYKNSILIYPTEEAYTAYQEQCRTMSEEGQKILYFAAAGVFAFLLGIFLTGKAGVRTLSAREGEFRFYERIYNDIFLVLYLSAVALIISLETATWESYHAGVVMPNELPWGSAILSSLVLACLTCWISSNFVKRASAHQFFRYTLIGQILVRVGRVFRFFFSVLLSTPGESVKKKAVLPCIVMGGIMLANDLFLLFLLANYAIGLMIFWSIISHTLILLAWIAVFYRKLYYLQEIEKGARYIRSGQTAYKIQLPENSEWRDLADDINNIGEGLQKAVTTATASEKMKTELITNVSHDLKTPLTSIIGYIDLLSQEEGLSPEAKDYVSVIRQKSEKLKHIIADLFDLSKAASQNASVEIERLGLKKLVLQTLGDMDDRIQKGGKTFKTTLPEYEVYINADGKRLYRVLQNLIDNALKYSMEGTRIHIRLYVRNWKAFVEISNIASYEMEFTEDEIKQRFVRGDKSRSTEGSGLGLSIAESFTELCGGTMELKIDGDMFKVTVSFPLAE